MLELKDIHGASDRVSPSRNSRDSEGNRRQADSPDVPRCHVRA